MLRFLFSLFIILHGLVHLWYFALSQRLVEFQPDMGWTGRSWLLSNSLADATIRSAANVLFILAAVAFVIAGIALFFQASWAWPLLAGSAVFSSVIILIFWDGSLQMAVQKGLLGLLINIGILVYYFWRI